MRIEPLPGGFVAEASGVDLSQPISEETAGRLREAFARHLILLLRNQEGLEAEDQLRFCSLFGAIGRRSRPAESRREGGDAPAEVMFVSNRKQDGRFIGSLPEGEMEFHIDQCYVESPARATCLFALVVPETGGDTLFIDLTRAYATLPDDLRRIVDHHKALNVFSYDSTSKDAVARSADARSFAQPMVVRHPESGVPALYVNRLMTTEIIGLDPQESRDCLDRLIAHAEQPQFMYRHRWRVGDLLLWDNLCTMHARTDFDPAKERHLRRFTLAGAPLVAA